MAALPRRDTIRPQQPPSVFLDPRALAAALGGQAFGHRISAPGPGHSRRDRSLSIKVGPDYPDGFLVNDFAGDDWATARDYIREAAGLPDFNASRRGPTDEERAAWARRRAEANRLEAVHQAKRNSDALKIWRAAVPLAGTIAEAYLQHRLGGLPVPADVIEADTLRFNPRTPFWNDVRGADDFLPAMVALFRNVMTGEPQAIHRTALKSDGSGKAEMPAGKRMLGATKNAAIMLTPFEDVTLGLGLAEGIETALTIASAGWRPIWAAGAAGAIARFPVLAGIDALTVFADNDETGAGLRDARTCATRWSEANRECTILRPPIPLGDWNDYAVRAA